MPSAVTTFLAERLRTTIRSQVGGGGVRGAVVVVVAVAGGDVTGGAFRGLLSVHKLVVVVVVTFLAERFEDYRPFTGWLMVVMALLLLFCCVSFFRVFPLCRTEQILGSGDSSELLTNAKNQHTSK